MTVSVQVSVNGNYKLPVRIRQGARDETLTISGRGHDGPKVEHISFSHGPEPMLLELGPESQDNGDSDKAAEAE